MYSPFFYAKPVICMSVFVAVDGTFNTGSSQGKVNVGIPVLVMCVMGDVSTCIELHWCD